MIFTLETLKAKKGDALILHYGENDDVRHIVIDGGPGGVYNQFLRPRLMEIADNTVQDDHPLPLSMVMVSHVDDDHINGVLGLTAEVVEAVEEFRQPPFDIEAMWFNAFDDIVGNSELPGLASLPLNGATVADVETLMPTGLHMSHGVGAVVASVNQGRRLRKDAEKLSVPVNSPFERLDDGFPMVRASVDGSSLIWDDRLHMTVVHPDEQRLREMQEAWDKKLKKYRSDGDRDVMLAAYADESPYNLASIVVLVEFHLDDCKPKRMLLTGDARGDDILRGLDEAGLMHNGRIHVDILKIPHHGSDNNVNTDFFRRVTADHYVVCCDGSHNNPEIATLGMLSRARRDTDDNFELVMTYRDGKHGLREKLDEFFANELNYNRTYTHRAVGERDDDPQHGGEAISTKVDLLDAVTF